MNGELKDGGATGPMADRDWSVSERSVQSVGVNGYGASGWPGAQSPVITLE